MSQTRSIESIRQATSESTPLLARAMEKAISPLYSPPEILPAKLQLRHSYCGIATAALQGYLRTQYDIETSRYAAEPPLMPQGAGFHRANHVLLKVDQDDDPAWIDPSWSQFFRYVGLDARLAHRHPELTSLYPDDELIAVFNESQVEAFSEKVATQALGIRTAIQNGDMLADVLRYPDTNALEDCDDEAFYTTYGDIWSLGHYYPYPSMVDDPNRNWVQKIIDGMHSS